MEISFSTIPDNLTTANGYGYAGFNMVLSLQKLGHRVPYQSPSAPVEIFFSQPEFFDFTSQDQYKIGYTPWESTALPSGWLEGFEECDEVWTPSPLIAQWYKDAGVTKDVHVYEHGIDPVWKPKKRQDTGKIRFLHHGEPAPRKGGQLALDAFRAAFGNRDDVELTFKAHNYSLIRAFDRSGSILGVPEDIYNNVHVYRQEFDLETQLIPLYHRNDVMVYPSYGEGFGLIPLQAMGTGMVTICTGAWAPYERLLEPELKLNSTLGASPWEEMHPGNVFHPDFDHLVDLYRYTYDNFDSLKQRAYKRSFQVHQEYDWTRLTESAFGHIFDRFG